MQPNSHIHIAIAHLNEALDGLQREYNQLLIIHTASQGKSPNKRIMQLEAIITELELDIINLKSLIQKDDENTN
jgi:hypothetical protein